jgi:hypothetical protein
MVEAPAQGTAGDRPEADDALRLISAITAALTHGLDHSDDLIEFLTQPYEL